MKSLIYIFVVFLVTYANAIIWPLSRTTGENGDVITSAFGPRNNQGTYQIHYGLDLQAAEGTVFYSIADGYVEQVGSSASTGNFISIRHLDNSYVRYIHLQSQPPYTSGEFVQEDQVIGLTGSTGTTYAHLHIDYFPFYYSPSSPYYREDTQNPLIILPHNTSDNYEIDNFNYVINGGGSGEDLLRFDVRVNPKRLDVDKIRLKINDTYDVYCWTTDEEEILDTQEDFLQPPGHNGTSFWQEAGEISLQYRKGYDFGPRGTNGRPVNGNFSTWNGVTIQPAEYTNSNQANWHRYTISFAINENTLTSLAGDFEEVTIEIASNDLLNSPSITEYYTVPVYWTEEWPADMCNNLFNNIDVGDQGRILIQNANSSSSIHPAFDQDMTIQSGGTFELEDGPNANNRTWFELDVFGELIVESGGTFRMGDQSRFLNYGFLELQFGAFCYPGTGAEVQNYGVFIDYCGLQFNMPGSCITINGGVFRIGANTTVTFTGGGILTTNNNPGLIYLENNAQIIVDGINSDIILDEPGFQVTMENNSKITIGDPSKMILYPGSFFRLGDNCEININGIIDAQGTAAEPITFTSLYPSPSTSQYWKWLKLDGSQDSDPPPQRVLDNVIIKYADYGIHATQVSDLTLTNSTIQKCWLENIYLNKSYAYIDNCMINIASFSTANGIYLYESSPLLYNTAIRDNGHAGVYCFKFSSPKFGETYAGMNVIRNNDYGVYANLYSNPLLGEVVATETIPQLLGGYNSIYDNESAAVKAISYCDIMAQYNWWGGYPVDPRIFDIEEDNSSLDYSEVLESDPNEEAGTLAIGSISLEDATGSSPTHLENPNPRQLLKLAKKLRVQKRPGLALPVYKRLILNFPNKVEARWGLVELISTFKEAGRDSAVAYLLNTIAAHPNQKMKRVAFDMLTGEYLEKRNANAAAANAQQIVSNYPNTESEKTALFDLINIYFHNLNDLAQAQTYLSQLESKYPNDELTLHAQMLLGSGGGLFAKNHPAGQGNLARKTTDSSGGLAKSGDEEQLPETFMLFQNYPNPFNPETTIQFGLPEAGQAELTVYSLTGQKVKTLVAGFLDAGYHTVKWDGTDASGNAAASGIYIYQLSVSTKEAGSLRLVNKMLLIK